MITFILIGATVLVSLYALQNRAFLEKMAFIPSRINGPGEWYRFITHGFVHADIAHLAINMFVLFSFGRIVEQLIFLVSARMPVTMYLLLYLSAMIAAALPGYFRHRNNVAYTAVGASGAIAAILFFFILYRPSEKLMLIFLPIPINAVIFGILYLAYEFIMDKKAAGRIAHDAHFWGAVYGIVFGILLYPPVISHFIRNMSQIFG